MKFSKLMRDCVEICGKLKNIPVEGFGPLENCNSLKGKFETYPKFISHTIKEQETLLNAMEQSRRNLLEEAWQQLERFFTENSNQISAKTSCCLTLVDANPANFIISTQSQKMVVIDLEVFVGADELFMVGSWMANLYGTRAFSHFKQQYSKMEKQEETMCVAFGLMRILNIMIHLGLNTEMNLEDIKPFGNHLSFMTIISEFCNILKSSQSSGI